MKASDFSHRVLIIQHYNIEMNPIIDFIPLMQDKFKSREIFKFLLIVFSYITIILVNIFLTSSNSPSTKSLSMNKVKNDSKFTQS